MTTNKATPLFDDWAEALRRRLAPRGQKSALARFLAEQYGGAERDWQRRIQVYLKRTEAPSAETLLAINRWVKSESAK